MITKASAFLEHGTSDGQVDDDLRSRVVLLLCQHRYAIEELGMALNCAESMLRSLLARPYRSLYAPDRNNPAHIMEPINLRMLPQVERAVDANPAPVPEEEIARQQEKSAHQLAIEVRSWLCTFEARDRDRQRAIEQAGFLLDESPLTDDGMFQFGVDRVLMEFLGVWGPYCMRPADREFAAAVSPWLASWIRFWVTDPTVWNRALALEYAHFGTKAQAA
jgi:hypothetical protein